MIPMSLEEIHELFTVEVVGGDVIVIAEGVKISVGRRRNGVFVFTDNPKVHGFLSAAKAAGVRVSPSRAPIPKKEKEVAPEPPPAPKRVPKRKAKSQKKGVGISATSEDTGL